MPVCFGRDVQNIALAFGSRGNGLYFVGLLYCSAEANSLYQIQLFEAALDKDGIAYKEYAIADTNEVQSVTTAAAGECDVLYIPTDNTLASVTETVYNVVAPAKIVIADG